MLTEGEKLRAQRLMLGDRSYAAIAHKMHKTADEVRRALRPQIRQKSALLTKQRNEALYDDGRPCGVLAAGIAAAGRPLYVPGDRLLERDRAMAAERSLTAILCGDPPYHRSALAQKRLWLVIDRLKA